MSALLHGVHPACLSPALFTAHRATSLLICRFAPRLILLASLPATRYPLRCLPLHHAAVAFLMRDTPLCHCLAHATHLHAVGPMVVVLLAYASALIRRLRCLHAGASLPLALAMASFSQFTGSLLPSPSAHAHAAPAAMVLPWARLTSFTHVSGLPCCCCSIACVFRLKCDSGHHRAVNTPPSLHRLRGSTSSCCCQCCHG